MVKLYIKPQYLSVLQDIFREHCPQAVVWAYGSRVNATEKTAHSGSDLDLAIERLELCEIDIYKLRNIIKDSNIPFLIDIFDLSRLPKAFQDEIRRERVEIFPNVGVNVD